MHIIINLSKPRESATTNRNSDANYRFVVIICVNVGLLILTNVPLRSGVLVMEKAMPLWEQGEYRKSLYILPNSVVNIILLNEIKLTKKEMNHQCKSNEKDNYRNEIVEL